MLSKKAAEYLRRQRELGYEPSLNGMDEEDFDYVPSWVLNRQPAQPLAREFRPVDRNFYVRAAPEGRAVPLPLQPICIIGWHRRLSRTR